MTSSGTLSTDAADSDADQLMVCDALLPVQDFHLTFDALYVDSNGEVRAIQKISACENRSAIRETDLSSIFGATLLSLLTD